MVQFRKRKSDGQSFPVGNNKKIRASNPSNDVGGFRLGKGTKVPNGSVEQLLLGLDQNDIFEQRLKEAKRQNQGYEQLMETIQEQILDGQKNSEDVSFLEDWLRKVVDAERIRPDKSFYYHWVTREVEDIIEANPDIDLKNIKQKLSDLDVGIEDSLIDSGIEELKQDNVIQGNDSGFRTVE